MKKKCNVVMLASQKANDIGLCNSTLNYLPKHQNILIGKKEYPIVYQHLYILSDDKIKEGDYAIDSRDNKVYKFTHSDEETMSILRLNSKKIIVTTNPELWTFKGRCNCFATTFEGCSECLELLIPKISLDFVLAYIKAYNKGEQIKEVMVEWNTYWSLEEMMGDNPKVSSNGTVSITPVEERKYTRDEVLKILQDWEVVHEKPKYEILNNWFNKNY